MIAVDVALAVYASVDVAVAVAVDVMLLLLLLMILLMLLLFSVFLAEPLCHHGGRSLESNRVHSQRADATRATII